MQSALWLRERQAVSGPIVDGLATLMIFRVLGSADRASKFLAVAQGELFSVFKFSVFGCLVLGCSCLQ